MILKTFIEPPIDNNNYLLIDEASREAALIDCSAVDDDVKLTLKAYDAKLKYILLTHGHFDHIAGINAWQLTPPPELVHQDGLKVLMHKADVDWVKKVNMYLPSFGIPDISIPVIDKFISEGDVVKLGNLEILVIETPGHTQGGVCFYTEGKLFSGDTIFRGSVGRCDLEGGDYEQIVESIQNKIFTLPEETEIYPGHGRNSDVGWEKTYNRFL